MDRGFRIKSDMVPCGDQPEAIRALVEGIHQGTPEQTLLGATGTGKTFTMANVIEQVGRPTLIISHNKTLAAQLYEEMKELFPDNAVSYFVSYYDYYQPEAYIPQRDIYIEKDASRNAELDRLRLAATSQLLSRDDCIIVSSVSCIFGLGSPTEYARRTILLEQGTTLDRREFLLGLAAMQYKRKEIDPERGCYRVRGDCIEILPAYEQFAIRVELFGDEIDTLQLFDPLTGEILANEQRINIFPAVHYVMPEDQLQAALESIREELDQRVGELRHQGRLLEAQRLLARTRYDLEVMEEIGYCSGIENYARHLDGRSPGDRAYTLLDYFMAREGRPKDDWLVFIDESHVTIPQLRGMYNGDRKRKEVLVDHGFRLPSALDNRPLRFEEFVSIAPQLVHVSATPGPYELEQCEGVVTEQIIRPTGLVDPPIEVRPATGQVPDLLQECRKRTERGERTLITALTKRLCEELSSYLHEQGLRVRYLHSEIDTLDRIEILRDLRQGAFDVLVGVNLLREGLDLPEVSLVCILDADSQGFLRSKSSLIQTMGRAARNANSEAIMYADTVTPEMQGAIDEVQRRRTRQLEYNKEHNITARTVQKAVRRGIEQELSAQRIARSAISSTNEQTYERSELTKLLEQEMLEAADELRFEDAARLRDELEKVRTGPEESDERVTRTQDSPKQRTPGAPNQRGGRGRRRKG